QRSDCAAYQIRAGCRRFTSMDADAQRQAPVWSPAGVAIDHPPLHCDGTLYRFDWAGELDEQPAAGRLSGPAGTLRNRGIDKLTAMRLEPLGGAFPAPPDHAGVARRVSSERHDETSGSSHAFNPRKKYITPTRGYRTERNPASHTILRADARTW